MLYNNIDISDAPFPAYAIAYYTTGAELGIYDGSSFSFGHIHDEKNLLELHIFDETKEFRIMKSSSKNRYISSAISDEESSDVTDEYMFLIGETYVNCKNKITEVMEKGHTKKLYLELKESDFDKGIRIGVRNYIDYDCNGSVYVREHRYFGLFVKEGEKYNGLAGI